MNFNSKILKISIVIALIFMIIPIVAAEDTAADSVYTEEQSIDDVNVVQAQDEINDDVLAADDDLNDYFLDDVDLDDEDEEENGDEYLDGVDEEEASADLEIVSYVTPQKLKVGDYAVFSFVVYNNGPDMASNVVAYANIYKGDVLFISYFCSHGVYDSYTGVWDIGDLESGEYATLNVLGQVLSDTQIVTIASVMSDTPDPDESNNYYLDYINVESDSVDVAAETETLPATGNPILMVLLAVLTMVGVTVGRRK